MKNETESQQEQLATAGKDGTQVQRARPIRKPRGYYILQESADSPAYKIETAESYAGRKNPTGKTSNLKKLARIARVRKVGFVKTLATTTDILRYGPAIITGVSDEKEAA